MMTTMAAKKREAVQFLVMLDLEDGEPEDGEVCLVEFYKYNLLMENKDDAMRRRFVTLTWGNPTGDEGEGRFHNKDGQIVGAYDCRWVPVEQISVVVF